MGQLLTIKELCTYLRLSESTICRLEKDGLPNIKVGRAKRYDADKCVNWLEQRSVSHV